MGGGGKGSNDAQQILANLAQRELNVGAPLRGEVQKQALEAVKTGDVAESSLPLVSRSLEATMRAISRARERTKVDIGRAGIGRTPQAQRILGDLTLEGEIAKSRIPATILERIINRGVGVSVGGQQAGISGLSSAAASEAQVTSSSIAAQAAILSSIFGSVGDIGQGFFTPAPAGG